MKWLTIFLALCVLGQVVDKFTHAAPAVEQNNLVRDKKRDMAFRIMLAAVRTNDQDAYRHKRWPDAAEIAKYSHDCVEELYELYPDSVPFIRPVPVARTAQHICVKCGAKMEHKVDGSKSSIPDEWWECPKHGRQD
jgi:hypothetical protein